MERQTLPESGLMMRHPSLSIMKKVDCPEKKVFAGSGEDCDELTKGNCECVTIQPFTNFKGNQALCQVIFSGSDHNSHMCPKSAAEILNLLISVNDSGCNNHTTLHAAYKEDHGQKLHRVL